MEVIEPTHLERILPQLLLDFWSTLCSTKIMSDMNEWLQKETPFRTVFLFNTFYAFCTLLFYPVFYFGFQPGVHWMAKFLFSVSQRRNLIVSKTRVPLSQQGDMVLLFHHLCKGGGCGSRHRVSKYLNSTFISITLKSSCVHSRFMNPCV